MYHPSRYMPAYFFHEQELTEAAQDLRGFSPEEREQRMFDAESLELESLVDAACD